MIQKGKLNPYSIGPPPSFDPCEKCLVKACCSEVCDDRARWTMNNKKPSSIKIRLNKRKRKK